MVSFTLKRWIEAPPDDVWAVLTTHTGWTYWAGVGVVTLDRPGRDSPNGVGAIRVVRAPGLTLREQVTAFEPGERLAYRILSGAPTRNHAGEITLEERPHGTVVRWTVEFEPRVPGTGRVLAAGMRLTLSYILGRLENRMAPLEKHRSECPYADAPDGKNPGLRLRGRAAIHRALLAARTGG